MHTGWFLKSLDNAGRIACAFSVLSTLSHLESWSSVLELLQQFGSEIELIGRFFGKIVHLILIPWEFLRDLFFSIIPVQVPPTWRDPILLGSFVWLLPLKGVIFLLHAFLFGLGRQVRLNLRKAAKEARTINDGAYAAMKLEELKAAMTPMPFHNLESVIRGLRNGLFPREIVSQRLDILESDLANYESHINEAEEKTKTTDVKSAIEGLVIAAVGLALLIAISFDKVFSNSGYSALDILWKTLVVMVTGGIFFLIAVAAIIATIVLACWICIKYLDIVTRHRPFSRYRQPLTNRFKWFYLRLYSPLFVPADNSESPSILGTSKGQSLSLKRLFRQQPISQDLPHPKSYGPVILMFSKDTTSCHLIHDSDINYPLLSKLRYHSFSKRLFAITTWDTEIALHVANKDELIHLAPDTITSLHLRHEGEVVDGIQLPFEFVVDLPPISQTSPQVGEC